MTRKSKLTLIELLISMAIFSLMVSLLIKSFQVSSSTAAKLEDQSQAYDYARLTMGIITDDLNKNITNELKKFEYDSTSKAYLEKNKSLYFYVKADESNAELSFFIQSADTDSTNSDIQTIKAINYKINTEGNITGLYRYAKNYSPNNNAGKGIPTELFDQDINSLSTLSSPDDTSLLITDENLVKFTVYVDGEAVSGANPIIAENPSAGEFILKKLEKVRIELELKDAKDSGSTTNRTFTRTVFLKE